MSQSDDGREAVTSCWGMERRGGDKIRGTKKKFQEKTKRRK